MSDLRSDLCKKCIHTKVCMKDKNLCGDVFVPGNPMIFDNNKLWKEYEERKAKGFPCVDFVDANIVPKWIPVTERLPQEEKEYWCFCRGGAWKQLSWMDRYFWNGEKFEFPWGGEHDEVTHWMPLPTPPKEERLYDSLKRGLEQAINGECREEDET